MELTKSWNIINKIQLPVLQKESTVSSPHACHFRRILSIVNSDWLQHERSARSVYEYPLVAVSISFFSMHIYERIFSFCIQLMWQMLTHFVVIKGELHP